jgi:hypothetical protein
MPPSINDYPFRLWVVLVDDGGTLKLGVINASVGSFGTIYAVAEASNAVFTAVDTGAGDADAVGWFYTNSALTNKTFRVLGYLDFSSGLAAVGTWSVAPDVVRLAGQGAVLPGGLVQEVAGPVQTYGSTNTPTIPYDDTKPQWSEGIILPLDLAMTPVSACNFFDFEMDLHVSLSGAELVTLALFKDFAADAIAVASQYVATANQIHKIRFRYRVQAGNTTTRQYQLKIGTASGVTITYRGAGAASKYGGLLTDFFRVAEISG